MIRPGSDKKVLSVSFCNFGAVGAFFSSIKPGKKENLTFSWLWDMLRSISDFFPEVRFELLLFWPQFETRKRLTQSIICKSLFVNLNSWSNWWNWLILTTWYSQWLLILAGAHSIQPTIANSQNALPLLEYDNNRNVARMQGAFWVSWPNLNGRKTILEVWKWHNI